MAAKPARLPQLPLRQRTPPNLRQSAQPRQRPRPSQPPRPLPKPVAKATAPAKSRCPKRSASPRLPRSRPSPRLTPPPQDRQNNPSPGPCWCETASPCRERLRADRHPQATALRATAPPEERVAARRPAVAGHAGELRPWPPRWAKLEHVKTSRPKKGHWGPRQPQTRSSPVMSNNSTFLWWAALCAVRRHQHPGLERRRARAPAGQTLPADARLALRLQVLLSPAMCSAAPTGSAFPVYDVGRMVIVDSVWSSVAVGQSVATVAELCFAAQWGAADARRGPSRWRALGPARGPGRAA